MASSATTQRLLRELKDYTKSPNEALLHLGPVDEDDLLHWEAVLKGVKGTPYEGNPYPTLPNPSLACLPACLPALPLGYTRNTNAEHRNPQAASGPSPSRSPRTTP